MIHIKKKSEIGKKRIRLSKKEIDKIKQLNESFLIESTNIKRIQFQQLIRGKR